MRELLEGPKNATKNELVVIPDVRNVVVAHLTSKNDVVIVLF